jgi:hypothetical protein
LHNDEFHNLYFLSNVIRTHLTVKELDRLLACSGLSRPKVSLKVVFGFLIHMSEILNNLGSLPHRILQHTEFSRI